MGTPSLKLQTMSTKGTVTIRPRKFITNRLLERRQMVLDVHHPGLATPDKEMLKNMLAEFLSKAKGHKAQSEATVIFGVKTCFGGGKSSCFALVYDSVEALMKHEPKHRQIQAGIRRHLRPSSAASRGRRRRTRRRSSVVHARRSACVWPRTKLWDCDFTMYAGYHLTCIGLIWYPRRTLQ